MEKDAGQQSEVSGDEREWDENEQDVHD